MNKYIIGIIGIAVLGSVFFFASSPNWGKSDVGPTVASALTVEASFHDFGDIGIFDGKVEKDFILTNTGEETLTVLDGTTSCGCTEGTIDGVTFGMHEGMARPISIGAGENKTLTAIYDPLAHGPDAVGPVTRQLFLKTNSTVTPELEISVLANVVKE